MKMKGKEYERMRMRNETSGGIVPFQTIAEASVTTGLSQFFLRKGCKDGTVPHVMSGSTYMINVPALLRKLGADDGKEAE